jgi:hypothetical protein
MDSFPSLHLLFHENLAAELDPRGCGHSRVYADMLMLRCLVLSLADVEIPRAIPTAVEHLSG